MIMFTKVISQSYLHFLFLNDYPTAIDVSSYRVDCVAMPSSWEICFRDVAEVTDYPRILEVDVIKVVSDCNNVMSIVKVRGIRSWVIIVFPRLDQYNNWNIFDKPLLEFFHCHVFFELSSES